MAQLLTPELFEAFLTWLDPDPNKAAEEYERLRYRLIVFFSHRNAPYPEDLADETLNRVILKIGDEKIENKLAFFYGVAKNVYLESLRKEKSHFNVDDIDPVASVAKGPVEDDVHDCLNACLGELNAHDRFLLLDYYSENKPELRDGLARTMGMSTNAIRVRICRIKMTLKKCLQECLQSS